jgi:glycine hydroxymethyltransferase
MVTSGIRLGTPAATTRGFGVAEFQLVAAMIGTVLDGLAQSNGGDNTAAEAKVAAQVHELCEKFPIYRGR